MPLARTPAQATMGLVLALALAGRAGAAGTPWMGVNLEAATSDSPLPLFADAVRQSRGFYDAAAKWGTPASVDAEGWPTQDAILFLGAPTARLDSADPYRLSFGGVAEVSISVGSIRNKAYDAATNTTTAEVLIGRGDNVFLRFGQAWRRGDRQPDRGGNARGVTRVRLLRPGSAPGDLFDRRLLARLSTFGVVRPAVGAGGVNDNPLAEWSERTLPGAAIQSSYDSPAARRGIAWEYYVMLANTAGVDLYLTLPLRLTDDHVKRLAQLIRFGSDGTNPYTAPREHPAYPPLDPRLHLYVEYANELWNAVFWTNKENESLAQKEASGGDPHHYGRGTPTDLGMRRMARRLVEIGGIFREVFGEDAMGSRIRPVLAAQIANPGSFETPLEYLRKTYGPGNRYRQPPRTVAQLIYAVAGAPYLPDVPGPGGADAVFEAWGPGGGLAEIERYIEALRAIAAANQVRMIAYESGQHLLPSSGGGAAKAAAQLDPRMKDVLVRLYERWYAKGGDLALYYSLCGAWGDWGFWGLSDDLAADQTPKWEAVRAIQARRPEAGPDRFR